MDVSRIVAGAALVELFNGVKIDTRGGESTVKTALLVTLPQVPLTSTEYVPESLADKFVIMRALFVFPDRRMPSFLHWYPNGPVPTATVAFVTLCPTLRITFVGPTAEIFVKTISVAQFVTLPQ